MCCEPISLLHSSRASSCEQKLCEPISLSLERALSSETGSQDPCSARHAVAAWQHFMLLWSRDILVNNTWIGIDCSTREYEEGESGSVGVTGVWPTMGQGHVKGRRSDCTALVGVSYLSAKSEELKGCSRHPWCRSLRPACLRRLHPRKAHTVTLRKLRRETFVWNLLLLLLGSLGPSTVTCREF